MHIQEITSTQLGMLHWHKTLNHSHEYNKRISFNNILSEGPSE